MISVAYNTTNIISVTNELDHADRRELYKSVVVYRAITFPDINRLITIEIFVINQKYEYRSGFCNNVLT